MSSLAKNIVLAAALSVTSAIQLERGVPEVSLKRWMGGFWNENVFNGCDQSIYIPGGVYELRLNCDKHFIIKKHEQGKVFDLKTYKIEHDADIGYMKFQRDGNLVVYSRDNEAMWDTGTFGNERAYMDFQNDGNLVIYKEKSDGDVDVLWASQTFEGAQDYQYFWENNETLIEGCGPENALYQSDYGNPNERTQYRLLFDCDRSPPTLEIEFQIREDEYTNWDKQNGLTRWRLFTQWELPRAGEHATPSYLVMQDDGNMVVYSTEGRDMWASDTWGAERAFVQFQDDGALQVYKHQTGGAVPIGKYVYWTTGISSSGSR